jgi:broad-specificity NMP kinase
MTRLLDLYQENDEELREELAPETNPAVAPHTGKTSVSEAARTRLLVKRARNKRLLKAMENPFEDEQDIMQYLNRAIDSSRSPLDQLELKMFHESLCREMQQERGQKKK